MLHSGGPTEAGAGLRIHMPAERKHYSRAPLMEAVIELRFAAVLSQRDMERLRGRFKSKYISVEEMQTIEVLFEGGKFQSKASPGGYKMTAKSAADVVVVNPYTLGTSRLAPYEGWDPLTEAAKVNFDTFTKTLGRQKVARIGARFVNRIDIPNSILKDQNLTDFVRLGVTLNTEVAQETGSYSVAVNAVHRETKAKLLIQSATILPVLLDHTSVTLDIDAFWDDDVPQKIEDVWAKFDLLRIAKNAIFETSVTDKARALFQ